MFDLVGVWRLENEGSEDQKSRNEREVIEFMGNPLKCSALSLEFFHIACSS